VHSFRVKMRQNGLVAGLCSDPLGSLQCCRDPLAVFRGGEGAVGEG